jgi:phenylalanine-4-hydroxylase
MIKILGGIYWYTIEFGLAKEDNSLKFYGAGIASSLAEIKNF